jgi:DNA primase
LGYDDKRARMVFPVILPTGEIVGGTGRVLGDSKPKYYKYAADYNALFGEQFVDRDRQELVLVEGPLDAIVASRVLPNVCALQGLTMTAAKTQRVRKYADSVTLLFDSDPAGCAGVEAVGAKLCRKLRVFVALLASGDPAEAAPAVLYDAFCRRTIYHRTKFF